ncbi:replication-relaxation family protein [Fictibacillus sp. 18YEL24]|uniref:replication-relaxation family protein n=1 Tax=Fictibacillus sp. 18YEL24 TaxID=2745875 RepID=UPI0018CD3069|nr:replication-relaxation family protein [Fictibacillus sp. 18YEL24]MBH0169296.1 replication-relaxation family protein [Fictibacillus sp. 18YEL24]
MQHLIDPIIVIDQGHNRKKLNIGMRDLVVFQCLLKEKLLTEKQLYRYYTIVNLGKISYPGFWKKLVKFEEFGLIKGYKYKVGQNGTTIKYFSLKQKGYDLLVAQDSVPKHYENANFINIPKINLDHHFGTEEIILNSLIGYEDLYPFYQEPTVFPPRLTRVFPAAIPDGVLKHNEKTLYIEFDSGSEPLGELKSKVARYLDDAKEDKEVESDEGLLITLLDNSIPNRKGIEDRTSRIRNLTRTIISLPELLDKNVPIYILPLSIAAKGAVSYLGDHRNATFRSNARKISDLLVRSKCHNALESNTKEVTENYLRNYCITAHLIDVHEKTRDRSFLTLFQYKELGNIRDYDQIDKLAKYGCMEPGCTAEFLYVIYDDEEIMRTDVKISGALQKVRYLSLEALREESFVNKPYVFIRDTKSTVKKVYDQRQWPNLF